MVKVFSNMHIQVKPLKQPNPNGCSITCLRMILAYYGESVSYKEVNDFIIKATPDGGSFLSEMARFGVNKGFDVDLLAYNLYLTDPHDANLSKKMLLTKLQKELSDHKRDKYYDLMLESTIKGIEEGINFIIKRPDLETIKKYLTEKIPLSVRLNYAALASRQGDPFNSHDVVLCGLKDKQICLIDPEDASRKWVDIQDLMFAISQSKIISASAYLLAIRPK